MLNRTHVLSALLLVLSTESVSANFFSNFFSNLLYHVHFCNHPGPLCPHPYCGEGISLSQCDNFDCSSGTCIWKGSDAACNGNQDCKDESSEWYADPDGSQYYEEETDSQLGDGDGDGDYGGANQYEQVNGGDYGDRTNVSGGTNELNHTAASSSRRFLPYAIIGGILAGFIMIALWRKREEMNNADLSEELNPDGKEVKGSVQERFEDVQAGRTVSSLDHITRPTIETAADGYNEAIV